MRSHFHSPMVKGYCTTAQKGGTCKDINCSKSHDVIRCDPCNCFFPPSSFKEHQTGQRHLRNVASKGLRSTTTSRPPSSPSLQSTSSNLPTSKNPSPPSTGNTSTRESASRVNGSSVGGRRPTVAYCATTLQGDTCTDSQCTYSHDILRCEPCERSFPASLFEQHQSGKQHLQKVASNNVITPSTSRRRHPSLPQDPQPTPSRTSSSPSGGNPPTTAITVNTRLKVSHEEGLYFVVEGTGTASNPFFPSVNHVILVETTSPLSDLSIQAMALSPSPNPWCEQLWLPH